MFSNKKNHINQCLFLTSTSLVTKSLWTAISSLSEIVGYHQVSCWQLALGSIFSNTSVEMQWPIMKKLIFPNKEFCLFYILRVRVMLHNPGKLTSYYVVKTGLNLGQSVFLSLLRAVIRGLCIHAWLFTELKEIIDLQDQIINFSGENYARLLNGN